MHEALKVGGVEAIAHITGGGMDNVPRALPKGTFARMNSWPVPAPFLEVKRRSGMTWMQMLGTLNCGLGMVWVVRPEKINELKKIAVGLGYSAYEVGSVEAAATPKLDSAWELADTNWEGLDL